MSTTRLQEVQIAFGKGKQANLATAQNSAALWRFTKLNGGLADPQLAIEDDANEYGKGHEFATATFKTNWNVSVQLEKYLGAEIAAWAMCFGLGKVVKTGSGPYTYTCSPLFPANGDPSELPAFSYAEQIRPGSGVVLDRLAVGNVVEGWNIAIGSGPGRANSKLTVDIVGSGMVTDSATGITMPAIQTEKLLPSASAVVTLNGVDYIANANLVSVETGWKNNVRMDSGFYPGSGFFVAGDGTSGAVRGRMEFGNRMGNLKFVVRLDSTSTEYAKLKAQTTGTAAIGVTFDANNSLTITWQKIAYKAVTIAEDNQIATVSVDCDPMYHVTNGVILAVAKCSVDGICQ